MTARFRNVFILGTGRCGTVTAIQACKLITNYTAGHETRTGEIGPERLEYPARHIEADNRLSWFLGRLDEGFGKDAYYVHLKRDPEATARSFSQRYRRGIIKAYRTGILWKLPRETNPSDVCRDYVETVHSNIDHFLRDKPNQLTVDLENLAEGFDRLWREIGAEGDLDQAKAILQQTHNQSEGIAQMINRKVRSVLWPKQ